MNMKNASAKPRCLLPAAMVIMLVSVSSLSAGAESWKDGTVLVPPTGDQTGVRS